MVGDAPVNERRTHSSLPAIGSAFVVAVLVITALPSLPPAPAVQTPSASARLHPHPDVGGVPSPSARAAGSAITPDSHVLGHRPQSWHGRTVPPGAPVPRRATPAGGPPEGLGPRGADSSWSSDLSKYCFGVWPSEGNQSTYLNGCYGHDEPGVDPYSTLPGSAGNVTWTVTLPRDRSPTFNQSDLYTAIWFGMVLTDPFAWMDECFLELQFYPDSSWSSSASPGNWVGAAVAWQIEASTGYENTCFYQVLGENTANGTYLNMSGGDTIRVAMVGWIGSPYGENLTVSDLTSGAVAYVNMYNYAGRYALDPAYSANDFPNALQWTPGGQLPVSFSFENGHTTAPYPNNNSYGGCSSGPPPSTLHNPAVPCPSYDPSSWANDTLTPWIIPSPVFSNSQQSARAVQVGFSHDLGGISFIDPLSNGTCTGRDGSAWCSYPWFSYSCTAGGFEFGATDYPAVTTDFGQYRQFATTVSQNGVSNAVYPLTNFSVPACGATSYTLSIPLGSTPDVAVEFLGSVATNGTATFTGLLPGAYSLAARVLVGPKSVNWTASGPATVQDRGSPWTWVQVNGNATLLPQAGSGPTTQWLNFTDVGGHGWQAVSAGFRLADPNGVTTIPTNGSVRLGPGPYSILAYPRPGYNFSGWSVGPGAVVASPTFPFTWVVLTGATPGVNLTARFVPSTLVEPVYVFVSGSGTVTLGNLTFTAGSSSTTEKVGTYPVSATASSGSSIEAFYVYGSALVLGQDFTTNATLEGGTMVLEAYFVSTPVVTLVDQGGNGQISFGDSLPLANNTRLPVPLTFVPYRTDLLAVPPTGERFSQWSSSNARALWVLAPSQGSSLAQVNGSMGPATLTAHFVPSGLGTLRFRTVPGTVGSIQFSFATNYTNGSQNTSVPNGTYRIHANLPSGYTFLGWVTAGGATVAPLRSSVAPLDALLTLTSGSSTITLNATLGPAGLVPVTFVGSPPSATGSIDTAPVRQGSTVWVGGGTHTLNASSPVGWINGWATTENLTVVPNGTGGFTLVVRGSGTVYAMASNGLAAGASATPLGGPAPLAVTFHGVAIGGFTPYAFNWSFGDGTSGAGATATHLYTSKGTYAAALHVSDARGGRFAVNVSVRVAPPALHAYLFTNRSTGVSPLDVGFSGNATGGVPGYTYSWVFGDGNFGTGVTIDHTYSSPGQYNAVLTVQDYVGEYASQNASIRVLVPVAVSVAASPAVGTAPLNVSFLVSASGGSPPYAFDWSFGDGKLGTGGNPVHRYSAGGAFIVNVTATDQLGAQGSSQVTVRVAPPVPPVSVRLNATPGRVTLGEPVVFTVQASGGRGGFSYIWAGLPPGCTGTNVSTIDCVPTALGEWNVSVKATDAAGASKTATTSVEVVPAATSPAGTRPLPEILGLPGYGGYAVVAMVGLLAAAALAVWATRRARPPAGAWTPPVGTEPEPEEGTIYPAEGADPSSPDQG